MSGNQHVLGKLANEAIIHVYLSRKNLAKIQKQQGQPADVVTRTELDQLKKDLFLRKDLGNLKKRIVHEIDKCASSNAIVKGDDVSDSTSMTSTPVVEELLHTKQNEAEKCDKLCTDEQDIIDNPVSESDDEPVREIPTDDISDDEVIVKDEPELPDTIIPDDIDDIKLSNPETSTAQPNAPETSDTPTAQQETSDVPTAQSETLNVPTTDAVVVQNTTIDHVVPIIESVPIPQVLAVQQTDANNKLRTAPIYELDTISESPVEDIDMANLTPASASIHRLLDNITKKSHRWGTVSDIASEELIIRNLAELNVMRKYREMVNAHNDVMMTTLVKQIDKRIDDIKKNGDAEHRHHRRDTDITNTSPISQSVVESVVQPSVTSQTTSCVTQSAGQVETPVIKSDDSETKKTKKQKRNSILMLFKKHK